LEQSFTGHTPLLLIYHIKQKTLELSMMLSRPFLHHTAAHYN